MVAGRGEVELGILLGPVFSGVAACGCGRNETAGLPLKDWNGEIKEEGKETCLVRNRESRLRECPLCKRVV